MKKKFQKRYEHMRLDKVKNAVDIIKKEGYNGLLRVLYKMTKNHDKPVKAFDALNLIDAFDFSADDLDRNRQLMSEFEKKRRDVKSINWFIPYFLHAYYGGIYTIFRFASYFAGKKGIKTRLVLYDNPYISEDDIRGKIRETFPRLAEEEVYIYRGPDVNVIPYADISIATLWTSAYQLMKFKNTLGKFYFIQDYEPFFYPASSYYALSEATYRFGFHGIVNTPGLYDFVTKMYEMRAEYFVPAVDHHIFFPKENSLAGAEKIKLFLYGRPHHERNAFELAIATAKKVKALLADKIDIVSAGSEWDTKDYGVKGIVTNLGLLSYEETVELYRSCNYGLIFMFTKHPSYIPMELMASGSIVITNYNQANTWLLKDMINCVVVEPSPTYITEKLIALIGDPGIQKTIRENAIKTVSSMDWDLQMEKIYRFITGKS
jgi:glycosyltransferase involved in cell wall biosynthesis